MAQRWEQHEQDLRTYYASLEQGKLSSGRDAAVRIADNVRFELSQHESLDELLSTDFFLASTTADLLVYYVEFWQLLTEEQFQDSWSRLQDIQDSLRLLRRFGRYQDSVFLQFIEHQSAQIEKLYPYQIFASTEWVIREAECGVCSRNINSLDCPHIAGEIYSGKIATCIVKQADLFALALTENPRDKRCVIQPEGGALQFKLVEYLASNLRSGKIGPLSLSDVEEQQVLLSAEERRSLTRNTTCPCGSGIKYKKCCIRKEKIERRHFRIAVDQNPQLAITQLIQVDPRVALADGEIRKGALP